MSKGPFFTNRLELYRVDLVDLFTAGDVDIIPEDIVKGSTIFPIHVILENISILGTQATAPAVVIDNGTTGENIIASATLSTPVQDKAWYLAPAVNAQLFAVKPGGSLRLHKGTLGAGQATTFRSRADNVALITTAAAHGLNPGDVVVVADLGGTGYNGRVTVLTAPTTTTFTYANTGADESAAADTDGRVGAFDVKVYAYVMRGFNE